jgi:hypothetical protein
MRTLRQFLNEKEENREIQNIPPEELNELLSQFVYSVRKSDGTEYEPSSLRILQQCHYQLVQIFFPCC